MSDSKECPFCGEIIAIDAEACAQCGKLLEPGPGDSVGGDQIRLGDLKDVKGVAVGKGAQAVYIDKFVQAQERDPADKQAAMLPIFEVPFYRNRHFTGREALLSQLNERRDSGQTAVVTQAIVGLGGVGKTQLALAFSYQHQNSYSLVYWLRGGDRPTLGSDMLVLAQTLKLAQADTDVETGRAVLMRWLAQTKRPWLLVFDNVDTLEPRDMQEFVPKSGLGHVLITSRNPGWSSLAVVLQTDVFTPDEAVAFLLDRTEQTGRRAARKLARALGHLPLALEHAAAYVNRAGCSLSEYYEMFLTERQALLAEAEIPDAYHATVTTTWELAFKQIQKENQAAIELLNLCCFLAPDEIPLALLTGGAEAGILPEGLSGMLSSRLARNRALAGLQQYSLMRREDEMLFVHRLVQAVAQDRMGAERRQQWANAAVELAAHIFSAVDQNMLHTWEAGPRLLPHALAAAEYAAAGGIKTERAAYLNSWIGFYLQFRADYAGAQPYYEQALAIRQAELGERHPDTALSLNNLGGLLQDMGDLAGAKPYLEQALAIRQAELGERHPDTAISLNNLGFPLQDMGDLAGAKPYLEQALAIRQAVLGERHPDTALSLNNLGSLLQDMGDLAGAQPYYEQALAIRQAELGERHPATASSLNNLGFLLQAMGDLAGAQPYYEQALAIRQAVLGERHPDTALSLNNLGSLLRAMGDLAGAKAYLEQALAIRQAVLGERHPDTALSLNNLGSLLRAMGDLAGAQPYLEQALAIRQAVLGERHPDTALSLNNLGSLLRAMGDLAGAKAYYEQALAILEERLGPEHPYSKIVRNNLRGLDEAAA